ncbi:MAG: hypothetical protein IT250_01945 [Chitinophagaceae bacterium]|nr:hypothetical protein [Chitinophagaceae bacterium]
MIRSLVIIALLSIWSDNVSGQNSGVRFSQTLHTEIALPQAAGQHVLRLFSTSQGTAIVTSKGVFYYNKERWTGNASGGNWILATKDPDNCIWLASATVIQNERGITVPFPEMKDTLLCMFWENRHTLHVGTSGGLYTWTGTWRKQPELNGIRINDIITDANNKLWAATLDGLWCRAQEKWVNLDETVMAVGHQRRYYTLATTNQGKDLVFSSALAVGCIAADGNHWNWSAKDGLPYGPINRIYVNGSEFWMATSKGAIQKNSAWHYYHGKRWMANPVVNDILRISPERTWIATNGGISELRSEMLTLRQKSAYYDSVIDKRHNRRGLVNISKLEKPGDLSSSHSQNEDNDGLWTACYLVAQCYRYAVTKDPDAKKKAMRTFEALERLETVTGISGYPARSYAAATDKVVQSRSPHPKHWHRSQDGKWQWLDDTSSDEITGHMYALSLFYELVADEKQKALVTALMNRMMSYIVDNDFRLIDVDGKPTRWGIWNPDSLNHSPNWMYERGLNSLQMLSFLKTAGRITGDARYEATYQKLVEKHGYARNALQAKMYGPFEVSHSDDILNFFPYYGLLKYSQKDPNHKLFIKSLERSWAAVRDDRMPVWNVLASSLLDRNCDLNIALEELQYYPLDLIDWKVENSHRWDIQMDPMPDRFGKLQAVHPIPTPESGVSRWNTNPKQLDVGRNGETEETGTYFLVAYWMGRYYGFWE